METIRTNILSKLQELPGDVGFYYKNLCTSEEIEYNADQTYIPASVIKLPVLMAIYMMAAQNEADLTEKILIKDSQKMPSCGALNSFTFEPEIDIKTLCGLMITISDNTATNVLISHYKIEKLNQVFEQIGLNQTRVNRLLFDSEASKKGIQNSATAREIAMLLEKLHQDKFVNEEISKQIKEILLRQQINHKLKEMLPPGTKAAHKTGEDDYITNDVGIVYAKQPFIISVFSNNTKIHEVNNFIRNTALELFNHCNK